MRFNRFAVAAVRLTLGLIVLAAATAWSQTPNTTTNITLQNLLAEHGAVTSGQVCATPSDAYGNPIAVSATGWGMILPNSPLCANVINGAIVGGLPVPDANHTSAASPIFYNIAVQWSTPEGPQFARFKAVAGVTGTSWALDGYTPPVINVPAIPSQALGYGSSIPSSCTSPSLYTTTSGAIYSCANGVYTPSGALTITANALGYGATVPSSCLPPAIWMTPSGLNYTCENGAYVQMSPGLVTGSAGSPGTIVGMSADGTLSADNGTDEKFFADFHAIGTNPDGSTMLPGWDTQQDVRIVNGGWSCFTCVAGSSGPTEAALVRSFPTQAGTTSLAAQARITYYGGTQNSCFGFTNTAPGTVSTANSQRFMTCFNSGGWEAIINGTVTPLFGPNTGTTYDVGMWYFNGAPVFTLTAVGNVGQSFTYAYLAGTLPSGIDNFEASQYGLGDQQQFVRYAAGGDVAQMVDMPYSPNVPGLWGTLTSPTAGVTFLMIPPNYKPGVANRAVLYFHGFGEVGWTIQGGGNQGVQNVAQSLLNAGYVVIGMNNTVQNCYGSPQCMTDAANVWSEWSSKLSLAPQPYLMAESMGGFQELNAVSLGVLHPRAMVGMCINTNMAWDYTQGGGASVIDPPYNITSQAQFPTAYDPNLASGQALANLAAVPTMLWSSYADSVVLRTQNTDLYAAKINAAGGNVVVNTSTGGHEDLSNFNGPAVVNFFNAH